VLHLVGKGNKPATMPLTVPVLRVLEVCRGGRTAGHLVLRPLTGNPIDRRDVYRMVRRIAKAASIPRHISPHSLRHAAVTNAWMLAFRFATPRSLRGMPTQERLSTTTEHAET
jgi:integrase/recombinase XerD